MTQLFPEVELLIKESCAHTVPKVKPFSAVHTDNSLPDMATHPSS